MLYRLLKIYIRLAALIFCRKIVVNNRASLKEEGPLLIASNHPNSFLDAVILDILFKQPVWSLARGDAFVSKRVARLFHALKILPVYRTSEGVENLSENYKTFDACIEIFRNNGLVQIFSEGKCVNEWHLRPLKKGTARLAFSCWEKNIPLKILPVAINYSSFRKFGKNIFIYLGTPITIDDIDPGQVDGLRNQSFNNLLKTELEKGVYEIDKSDGDKRRQFLAQKTTAGQRVILFLPALAGFLFHAPLYLPVRYFVKTSSVSDDHHDSILLAMLILVYPFYILLIAMILFVVTKSLWMLLLFILLPFAAWSYVRVKRQID